MKKTLFILFLVMILLLSGCNLPESTREDFGLDLDPGSGSSEESYHIEIDVEYSDIGTIEALYWQISESDEYDDNEWEEASTCLFLCDYVIDIENVEDGDYYIHFKAETLDTTGYIISDNSFTVKNPEQSLDISLDPLNGTGESNYHIEIDMLYENIGYIDTVYWQVSNTTDYDENNWKQANTCLFLCDYVIDLEDLDSGDYYIHFKIVTNKTTLYRISQDTYSVTQDDYTISIDPSGGIIEQTTVRVDADTLVSSIDIPTKLGYRFKEWQVDGEPLSFPFIMNKNINIVAIYEELAPHEVLFDYYYMNHIIDSDIVFHSNEGYFDIGTDNERVDAEYSSTGIYYYFYYDEDRFDVLFMITVDLVNSIIRYDDNSGLFYERDFLFTYYDGDVSLAEFEVIESLFTPLLDFGNSPLQLAVFGVYGVLYNLSDFNSNWDELVELPTKIYSEQFE